MIRAVHSKWPNALHWFSLILCLALLSCAGKKPSAIPSASEPWKPAPADVPIMEAVAPTASPEYQNKKDWTLAELIDLALKTNNETKITWFQAKAAAAEFESKKAAYYPTVDLEADLTKSHGSAVGGRFSFDQKSSSPSMAIAYVLYDFGKRQADAEEARQALLSASWSHNQQLQSIILDVQKAYYQYVNAKSLLRALQESVNAAQTSVDAAMERHKAGVGTIADELQAKTNLAQAQLDMDTVAGQIQVLKGELAVAIGLPATGADLDVIEEMPEHPPIEQAQEAVELLIRSALQSRPELQAARADALQAEARADSVHAEGSK